MDWMWAQVDDETLKLREFVRDGCLFAVQEWINSKKPLLTKSSRKQHALEIAVEKGFHSMAEILAEVWPDEPSLSSALHLAANKRRVDIVWLLLKYISDLSLVDLGTIAGCNDKELIRYFLDRWDEVKADNRLTDIVLAMPHPLIGLIREYAPRIPNSQLQLARALKEFVEENHPKWIALTIWMGGNPRQPAPGRYSDDDCPEDWTSALQQAVFTGKLDAVKLMKPNKELDDLEALLAHVHLYFDGDMEVAKYVVKCGANVNNKANGGSSVLDSLFRSARFRFSLYEKGRFGYGDVARVKEWIALGARWVPDDRYAYQDVRKAIQDLDRREAWKFIEFLSTTVAQTLLTELCVTPKTCELLEEKPKQLRLKIENLYVIRVEAAERQKFYPRMPTETTFVQKRPRLLGIKETLISRRQFYHEIWSRPLTEIAAEYRIGPEQLCYICTEHNVPRPKAGHWQKVANGKQPVRSKPLPDPEHDPEFQIRSYFGLPVINDEQMRNRTAALIERLAAPGLEVCVPHQPERRHSLVEQFRRLYKSTSVGARFISSNGRNEDATPLLDIHVSDEIRARAENVMNALLFFLEDLGLTVSVERNKWGSDTTQAHLFNGSARFGISKESRRMKLNLFGHHFRFRSSWSDARRQLVEQCFADFAASMVYAIALDDQDHMAEAE